jgi:hypothetical protein
MAEINIAASGKMPGVRRSKKLSTRVDLTPMVDLGFFPLQNGKIVYYHGDLENSAYGISTFSYSDGIGQIIRDKKAAMENKKKGFSRELFLIIKPTDESNVRQLTDLMDEVLINDLKHYAISDISAGEKELIIKLNGSL